MFLNVFERFRIFLNVFERFRIFLNVFERFFLAWFTQALQINLPNPVFTPKTNVTPKNHPQFSHLSTILDISTSKLQAGKKHWCC